MNKKIDNRLLDIASFIDKCDIIADVGTDHGYLPIYLVNNNIADKAIASDIRKQPLEIAKDNIKRQGLDNKIETILTSGLDGIPSVDFVIIAGMGGLLIEKILKEKKTSNGCYVLEPNNNIESLRRYLSSNNYKIIDEKVSYVHNKYYEIMKVIEGKKQALSEKEIKFGPINLIKKEENFINKWTEIRNKNENILAQYNLNDTQRKVIEDRIDEINKVLYENL